MLIIRGGRVIDIARRSAEPRDILVDGDTISAVLPAGAAAPPGTQVMDAQAKLLIPGLVNAHTHSHGALARGTGDRWTLELLLTAAPWLFGRRTMDDLYLAALIGAVEMVGKGVTACYDMFFEFPSPTLEGLDAVRRAYADVGMRAVIAPLMADRTFWQAIPGLREALPADARVRAEQIRPAPSHASLAFARRALAQWDHGSEAIGLALGPTIPLHCTDDFMKGCRDLANEFGCGVHMHVAESKIQVLAGQARYGTTLVDHLDKLGLVSERFTAAHGVWLDDDEIARLADRGASIAHNPGSNMRLGAGVAPVREMRDRNLNVGIGTDGAHCSDNQNVFEAMRLASFVSRIRGHDTTKWLGADEALTAATAGGARTLGLGDTIGRIAAGAKADIVFLDLHHVNYIPLHDPVHQVVHTEDGTGVDSVMIGGRLVVDRGRLTTLDTSRLAAQAEAAAERLCRANAETRRFADSLTGAVGTFCGALGETPYHLQRHIPAEDSLKHERR
jgi:guanine deaminase